MSPALSNNLFPRDSIIAINPITGRPLLPNLPTLPPRLRLGESDDNDDDENEEDDSDIHRHLDEDPAQHGYLDYDSHYVHSPTRSHKNFIPSSDFDFDPDIELDSSDLNFIGISRNESVIRTFMDAPDNEESRRGRERIERLLAEMMSRQRARARTITSLEPLSISQPGSGFGTRSSAANPNPFAPARGKSLHGRNKAENLKELPRFDLDQEQYCESQSMPPRTDSAFGGVGATMDPMEKDELMGLIMTSLRRKLQQAEDEGWMYGSGDSAGGIGHGLDIGGDSGYD